VNTIVSSFHSIESPAYDQESDISSKKQLNGFMVNYCIKNHIIFVGRRQVIKGDNIRNEVVLSILKIYPDMGILRVSRHSCEFAQAAGFIE